MDLPLTEREAVAGVMLRRLVEQFLFTKRGTTTLEMAMSRVPPPEREAYQKAFEALNEYKLVAEQSGEFFVTQYGSLFLEHVVPTFERRQLPLTAAERNRALSFIRSAVSSDARFDLQNAFGSPLQSAQPPQLPPVSGAGDPKKFWMGVAILGLLTVWCIFAVLKR
ncbi:hypothetical protein [Polaromonas sp.]|uniref:hypothetical protein n=1 Tax=Polaromonas sp. TaxID=1869339 RepID=UPI0024876A38|nr:hypothetical protein [Polaromonas sp.]MDI1273436.1 hypothetical protein [Polaromonas sp.]